MTLYCQNCLGSHVTKHAPPLKLRMADHLFTMRVGSAHLHTNRVGWQVHTHQYLIQLWPFVI